METGENVDKWDRLIVVVKNVGGKIIQREGGDLARVVWGLGGTVPSTCIDAKRVTILFGEHHKIDQSGLLEQVASAGVPVNVGPEGNLEWRLA